MRNPVTVAGGLLAGMLVLPIPIANAQGVGPQVAASAEQPAPRLPERVEIHTGRPDPRNGIPGIYAVGWDYKVSFHTGMTFYPRMGAAHPNQPLAWHTESVRIGRQELVTRKREGSRVHDFRFEYDLGAVVEAYDVLPEGLEQTFVIAQQPRGSGDLVVTGLVETPLVTDAVTGREGGLEFHLPSGEVVLSYGAATAVDAGGRTRAMTTSWDGGRITLTLDAGWLATAEFPLVVDPLLTTRTIRTVTSLVLATPRMDCVSDDSASTRDQWMSYCLEFSASDGDAYLVRYDSSGVFIPLNRYTDVGPFGNAGDSSVAFVQSSDRVVMVYETESALTGAREIRWHAHALLDNNLSTASGSITDPAGVRSPDIGGSHGSGLSGHACIGYVRGSGVFKPSLGREYEQAMFAILDLPPAGFTSGNQGTITFQQAIPFGTPIREMGMPRVVKTVPEGGSQTRWPVAWAQEEYGVGGTGLNLWQVRCAQMDASGGLSSIHDPLGAIAPMSAGPSDPPAWHAAGAEIVSRDGGVMLLVPWNTPQTIVGSLQPLGEGLLVESFVVDWPTPGNAAPVTVARREVEAIANPMTDRLVVNDAVADHVDGIRTAWIFRNGTDVVLATLGSGGSIISRDFLTQIFVFRVPPGICFDPTAGLFRAVFGEPGINTWALRQARWAYPVEPPVSFSGASCGPVSLGFEGSRIVGSGGGELVVKHPVGIPGSLVHVLYLALGTGNLPLLPFGLQGLGAGCTINLDPGLLYASALGVSSPGAPFHLPVGVPDNAPSGNYYWQALSYDAATGNHFTTAAFNAPLVR